MTLSILQSVMLLILVVTSFIGGYDYFTLRPTLLNRLISGAFACLRRQGGFSIACVIIGIGLL